MTNHALAPGGARYSGAFAFIMQYKRDLVFNAKRFQQRVCRGMIKNANIYFVFRRINSSQ